MGEPNDAPAGLGSGTDWRLLRLNLLYVLEIFELSRADDGDFLEALVHSLVASTSVAPVMGDQDLQARYATAERPPPDAVRRALPVHAIAQSLRLPYETIRRRVNQLVEKGELLLTRDGVVQPEAAVRQPHLIRQSEARYDCTKRLYRDLLTIGAVSRPDPASAGAFDAPPVRLVNRLIGEFSLRASDELITLAGSPTLGMVLLAVARANAEHIDPLHASPSAPIPESERRPARMSDLAVRLRLPEESLRRQVRRLVEAGLVVRVPRGVLVSDRIAAVAAKLASEGGGQGLRRLFSRLSEHGVLAWWDQEARAAGAGEAPGGG